MKEKEEIFDYITRVRTENLGLNVKRRVTLGNFLLSSKFDDFNDKVRLGQKIRRMLIDQWNTQMEEKDIDVVISPTTIGFEPQLQAPILRPKPSAQAKNPVYEYKMDYFTVFPNSLGIASVTLPIQETWGKDPETGKRASAYKFPCSVKVHSYFGEDYHLLRVCKQMEQMIEENGMKAF